MTRREFSNYVLDGFIRSHLDQTVEELSEATGIPVQTLLERAKACGISLKQDDYFQIARGIPKARNPAFED